MGLMMGMIFIFSAEVVWRRFYFSRKEIVCEGLWVL